MWALPTAQEACRNQSTRILELALQRLEHGLIEQCHTAEYQAATGKTNFLDVARKAADRAWRHFLGPDGKPGFCGHAELEMALVELNRTTGEQRYLDLARAMIDWRGRHVVTPSYEIPLAGYYESCAACGLADFAQRMFLLQRRAKSVDVLERVLLNAVLHGLKLDGTASYYCNPLTDRDKSSQELWCAQQGIEPNTTWWAGNLYRKVKANK